jgi:ABC-2 type transport system ATP-binding protein
MQTLTVEGLCKTFKKNIALNNLSFSLESGQIVALTGPNGAGKTTTLKCIMGLLNPTSGTVGILGESIKSDAAKAGIAYIPEIPELYPMLTVWEHFQFVAFAYGVTGWEPHAEKLIETFDLLPKRDELCSSLSKGMKQKVSICCALLHDSAIILIDEPMVGLDPKAIKEFKTMLLTLRDEGKTILLSTHMLDTAENLCDEVMVMRKGSLIFKGSLEDLKRFLHAGESTTLEDLFLEVTEDEV